MRMATISIRRYHILFRPAPCHRPARIRQDPELKQRPKESFSYQPLAFFDCKRFMSIRSRAKISSIEGLSFPYSQEWQNNALYKNDGSGPRPQKIPCKEVFFWYNGPVQ